MAKSPLTLLDPVKEKVGGFAGQLGEKLKLDKLAKKLSFGGDDDGEKLDLAAGIAVMVDINVAEARLGLKDGLDRDGNATTVRSQIIAGGAVEVTSLSQHRPNVSASGSAAKDGEAGKESDNELTKLIKKRLTKKSDSSATADGSAKDKKTRRIKNQKKIKPPPLLSLGR
ncbi:hypothetical protein HLB35_15615 [Halomonas sp. TBZ9]|uniref:Uncharacterized protein n=1 Tax=Vreelandella azerica TaxID=2732867 RepID=A0A7Y3TZ02_9GAMM|nr:hypothetical protein [Halomonas azerica]NOG32826.1 hypothetical protein [Halomonas azerica]